MIDFTTLQGLTIPEGVVTQITDESGRVIWAANIATDEPPAIFEVAKQTTNSYSGETQYTDNEFILFDIYPKKGGTVNVTYGGLTKTVKDTSGAEEPNAIQVFFGRFNGVSDSVATPASGTLTIEGAYRGYGLGSFGGYSGKSSGTYAPCVTSVVDFGNPVYIGSRTFYNCTQIVPTSLPSGLTSIESYTFYSCTNLALTSLPNSITSIQGSTFEGCTSLALTSLPSGITNIGVNAFLNCTSLALTSLPSGITAIGNYAFYNCTNITLSELPSGITAIGNYAFYNCTNITLSELPSGITAIGEYAFYNCQKLVITVFPEGLINIGAYAFFMDVGVTAIQFLPAYRSTITFPSTLESIGNCAFRTNAYTNVYHSYIFTAIMLSEVPPVIGAETFGGFDEGDHRRNVTFIVPDGCGETYKTASENWSQHSINITEAS